MPLLFILPGVGALGVALAARQTTQPAEASHAWRHEDGIGFAALDPNPTFGWLDVYVHDTQFAGQAIAAIDGWKELHNQNMWLLRYTTVAAEAEIEVMDTDSVSALPMPWKDIATFNCAWHFDPDSEAYAATMVTDDIGFRLTYATPTNVAEFGFWQRSTGHPFVFATVCVNRFQTGNNQGTIAHEFGHALGLDHVTSGTFSTYLSQCADDYGLQSACGAAIHRRYTP